MIRYSLTLYHGLVYRPIVDTSLNNADFESNLTPERSEAITSNKFESEYENLLTQKIAVSNNERLSDMFLDEDERRLRNLNLPRHSFENIALEEEDKGFVLFTITNFRFLIIIQINMQRKKNLINKIIHIS